MLEVKKNTLSPGENCEEEEKENPTLRKTSSFFHFFSFLFSSFDYYEQVRREAEEKKKMPQLSLDSFAYSSGRNRKKPRLGNYWSSV